jgi:hemolysin III
LPVHASPATAMLDEASVATLGFAEPVASLAHYGAVPLALMAAPGLIRSAGRCPVRRSVMVLFVAAVVFLFAASGTFHMLERGSTAREIARRVDHAAIWMLIAATLTAIHAFASRDRGRWFIIAMIWVAALTGLVLKAMFVDGLPDGLWLALYMGLGWFGTVAMVKIARVHGWSSVRLLAWGGLVYTVGAGLDLAKIPVIVPGWVGPHELFHVAVMLGVLIHWRYVQELATDPRIGTSGMFVRRQGIGWQWTLTRHGPPVPTSRCESH